MAEITPNDIINKEFRLSMRGYATEQVDDFLQLISDSQFRLLEENKRLQSQGDDLRARLQQYQEIEDLMKNALVLAERTAEETRQRAQHDAELLRREAEVKLAEDRMAVEELRQARVRIFAELRAILYAHLAMIEDQEKRHGANAPDNGA